MVSPNVTVFVLVYKLFNKMNYFKRGKIKEILATPTIFCKAAALGKIDDISKRAQKIASYMVKIDKCELVLAY